MWIANFILFLFVLLLLEEQLSAGGRCLGCADCAALADYPRSTARSKYTRQLAWYPKIEVHCTWTCHDFGGSLPCHLHVRDLKNRWKDVVWRNSIWWQQPRFLVLCKFSLITSKLKQTRGIYDVRMFLIAVAIAKNAADLKLLLNFVQTLALAMIPHFLSNKQAKMHETHEK